MKAALKECALQAWRDGAAFAFVLQERGSPKLVADVKSVYADAIEKCRAQWNRSAA